MTETQQYRVVADRDKGADPQNWDRVQDGDRVVVKHEDGEFWPVRIERPVPTTDEPQNGPTVTELASRHCETTTGDYTCVDDLSRSADSPYGATGYCYPCLIRNALSSPSPHPPTREQIAAVIAEAHAIRSAYLNFWGAHSSSDIARVGREPEMPSTPTIDAWSAALIQNGADR